MRGSAVLYGYEKTEPESGTAGLSFGDWRCAPNAIGRAVARGAVLIGTASPCALQRGALFGHSRPEHCVTIAIRITPESDRVADIGGTPSSHCRADDLAGCDGSVRFEAISLWVPRSSSRVVVSQGFLLDGGRRRHIDDRPCCHLRSRRRFRGRAPTSHRDVISDRRRQHGRDQDADEPPA
jgi:hypothetical protein